MKYACPEHNDVILFEDDDNSPDLRSKFVIGDLLETKGLPKTGVFTGYPRKCPKNGKWYYRHECIKVDE